MIWPTLALTDAQPLSQREQEIKQGKSHFAHFGQLYEKMTTWFSQQPECRIPRGND